MYAIIQFSAKDGGTLAIVNNRWLTPRRCEVYWPPVKGTKAFNQILDHCATPDEKWKLYGVQKVYYETDNIEKARKKLKLAEDTSDLQTEEDVPNIPKRRVQKTKRYITSSDEDGDNHTRPPILKKKFTEDILKSTNVISSLNLSASSDLPLLTTSILGLAYETELSSGGLHLDGGIDCPMILDSRRPTFGGGASTSASPAFSRLVPLKSPQPNLDSGVNGGSPSRVAQLRGYQTRVLSLLTTIKTQNDQIIQQNDSIIRQSAEIRRGTLRPDFKFPINTAEELISIEISLRNKENYDNLVSYIRTLGGRDVSSKVSRIMKFVFTDQLAEQHNFYGKRSNKKPFCQLRLRDCVVDGVVGTSSEATAKDVEDSIKIWLKHAPEPLHKSKKDKII